MKTLTASRDPNSNADVLLVQGNGKAHLGRTTIHYREGEMLKACYHAALEFGADVVSIDGGVYSIDDLRVISQ